MHHRRTSVWAWQGVWLALLWLACTSAPAQIQAQAQAPFNGFEGSVVRFASVEDGQRVLMADDDWIAATSDFQRSALMGKEPPATREAFMAFHRGVVKAWPSEREAHWRAALARVAPAFNALRLYLPKEVLLVNSDGRESADTPYTRAHVVVLPGAGVNTEGYSDDELLAHELFHIVSRYDPALATRLYATLGFEPAAPLEWPAAWLPLRIANPDAPHNRHLMRIRIDSREVSLMPLLVAKRTQLNRSKGETFFTVLDVRLLEVLPGRPGEPTTAVLRDGELAWHSPDRAKDYLARLGGNTSYIFHPEETMADNIAFLVSGRKVPNPALLQRIQAVLLSEPTP
ncbi:MAG: hypothetical protein V4858_14520 [Pseudomonadota bacterium]